MKIALHSHDLVSESNKKKANPDVKHNTLDTLIPVRLDDEEMEKFVKAFHPRRAAKAPQAFLDEARFMAELSAYLTSIFTGLRYGLLHASSGYSAEELAAIVTREIDVTYKASADLEGRAKEYLMSMARGTNHIIRDSVRYKGGKDIIYVGLRGANDSPLLHSGHAAMNQLPIIKSSYSYEEKKAMFESDLGRAFVETGLALQKLLLGDQSSKVSSSYKRIHFQHTVSNDLGTKLIEEINRLFVSGPVAKAGLVVRLPIFAGAQTEHAVNRLREYASIIVLREPNSTIVANRARNLDKPEDDVDTCLEHMALQPDLRFSFAINLPKNFCEFITQTTNEQIPLVPLNTWASVWSAAMLRPPKARSAKEDGSMQKGQGMTLITPHRAPRYVLRPSVSDELIARRKKLGLYSEKGRVNEDGIFITYNGDLAFLNTSDDSATKNAKEYEKLIEEALSLSFDAGTPLAAGQRGSTGAVFDLASPNYATRIAGVKEELSKYKGSVQAINWDLNTVLTVSVADPDRLVSTKLVGGARPDDLNLSVYLRSSFSLGMRDMFSRSKILVEGKRYHPGTGSFNDLRQAIGTSSLFHNFAYFYNHLLKQELVPSLAELVKVSAEALKIKDLGDEHVADFELFATDLNKTIYKQLIGRDLAVGEVGEKTGQAIVALLGVVADQAAAKPGSNLARICIRDNINFNEHDRFFDGKTSTVGEFSRLYQWLGGQIFYQAVKAILAVPRSSLLDPGKDVAYDGTDPEAGNPGFLSVMNEVMPLCVTLGKYVMPEVRDKIYERADEIKDAESKFTESDLNLAGSKPKGPDGKGGMKLFPHQAEALARLKAHPKIAILDISPGGGKTTIGLADIAMLYADGLIKRPFIIAPNRLVKNWIEDLHKSFNGWNIIPVTTTTYAEWGEERLTELIMKAPPNTIVVVGNSFLSATEKTQLVIGNAVDTVSNAVEFCKKFEPDYVLLDESHRVRNTRSAIHQGVKTINQMSSVKFGRIGTGTLIQNVLSDVVGQSAIFNGQIFRTVDEFEAAHKGVVAIVNDKQIVDYLEDTPLKARRRLSEFATVISYKRKEWAFMLPMPIETFIRVNMDKEEEFGVAGHKLQQFYNAVLKQTLEEAKNDPLIRKKKKGDDEGDDDGNDENEDRKVTTADGKSIDVSDDDDDSDLSDELEAALEPYLQRLERLLTDPFGDEELLPVAKEIFGEDFDENYVTPKVKKVIERIEAHFRPNPWEKGRSYKASQIVDYNGKTYIFKSELKAGTGEEQSDKAPDSDVERWKPQIRGKIFIACRYTRSVDAIYRALPKSLRDQAVRFHGEVAAKDDNLARFQTDDKVQILIANEMGISEGHNFQMASRFIRVEAPWAPGELDQTAARIFRPDVGGEYTRQTIFLDWIICDHTLEVAKMGRLISKMLKRAKFDELDNPKYYKSLNPLNLPVIKMSLENIQQLNRMDDLAAVAGDGSLDSLHPHSYLGQYGYLLGEMGDEFREMRATKRAYMLDVEPTPMPEGSSVLEFTPWVPNMKVVDRNNDGLIPLRDALEDMDNPLAVEFKKNHRALIGQYVRTEFGIGIIDKVTTKRGISSDEEGTEDDSGNEVSKVRVKLVQGGNVEMLSASKVFLATNITEQNKAKYNKKAPKITDKDKERTQKQRTAAEQKLAKIRDKDRAARKNLEDEGKRVTKRAKPVAEPVAADTARSIYLYPVVYNEFLALEGAEDEADSKAMQRFGFERFGNYAYLPIKTYQNFTVALEFLEKNYTLSPKTTKYLDLLHESFQSGRGRKFALELAPVAELPKFHIMRHRLTQVTNRRKPELKLYPMIINTTLMLLVDLTTNPVFRRQINKTIPGMAGINKFQEADGMDIQFFRNKSELVAKVRELRQNGFKIENLDELKEEVEKLSLRTAKR